MSVGAVAAAIATGPEAIEPAEYPVAQPSAEDRNGDGGTRIEDYAKNRPGEKFQKEQLELLNGLYPKGEPRAGDSSKVVE